MPVNYVLVERPNPLDSAVPRKCYAQAKASGSIHLKQLSKNMAARCKVTSSDILAVLDALKQEIVKHSSALGIAPAHQLFDAIKIEKNDKGRPARSFGDYTVTIDKSFIPQGVELIEML
jgi:CRISPR-associated protein Csd2